MTREVEIRTRVNTLNLFKSEWHLEFDISSGICIVSQFLVVVEAIFLISKSEGFMPTQAELFPMFEPFQFLTRTNEELHLHLFEFTHTENKLTSNDFISKGFTYLANTKRHLHSTGFLHIKEIDKNTLCRFRTEIYFHCTIGS